MNDSRRTPLHLWIVAGVSTIWNAFGAFDYVMTQTRNHAYLAKFTEPQRVYFDTLPVWTQMAWALGVWGALAGSLLLFARSRHAVRAFAVSLAGLAVSTICRYVISTPPEGLDTRGMLAMNVLIWAISIGLLIYARRQRTRGRLR